MIEQHKRYLRFNNLDARKIASRLLRNADDSDTGDEFEFDGWVWKDGMRPEPVEPVEGEELPPPVTQGPGNSWYYAIKLMGANGRVRYPEGHASAGQLIPGYFIIMAWQGPLSEAPQQLRDNVVTDEQIANIFPDGPPEVMG